MKFVSLLAHVQTLGHNLVVTPTVNSLVGAGLCGCLLLGPFWDHMDVLRIQVSISYLLS